MAPINSAIAEASQEFNAVEAFPLEFFIHQANTRLMGSLKMATQSGAVTAMKNQPDTAHGYHLLNSLIRTTKVKHRPMVEPHTCFSGKIL